MSESREPTREDVGFSAQPAFQSSTNSVSRRPTMFLWGTALVSLVLSTSALISAISLTSKVSAYQNDLRSLRKETKDLRSQLAEIKKHSDNLEQRMNQQPQAQ